MSKSTMNNATTGNAMMNNAKEQPTMREKLGILEWFRPGEHQRVESVLRDLQTLGIEHLRTGISWADWHTPGGREWYNWFIPRVSSQVELLPCFLYTPPSLGIVPKTSSPPRTPKDYADFLDVMITDHGEHFEWVELWNEPNNAREWDWTLDKEWTIFAEMISGAAYWARHRGKRVLLGGMSPFDPNWLELMFERGVMQHIDALGLHGFPDTFEFHWEGWPRILERTRAIFAAHDADFQVWITEVGFSTWQHDEYRQVREFLHAAEADVSRVYWYAAQDLDPELPTVDGFHSDEREYHFGLRRADGTAKLLFRLWADGGVDNVREWLHSMESHHVQPLTADTANGSNGSANNGSADSGAEGNGSATGAQTANARYVHKNRTYRLLHSARYTEQDRILITGGAGFIGTNLAHRLLSEGHRVTVFDSLARPGVERNLGWLRSQHGDRLRVQISDVRNAHALRHAVRSAAKIFHLAGQVAVTTSLDSPIDDFAINARGTLNLLEEMRRLDNPPPLLFASTNKVYGNLHNVPLRCTETRYEPQSPDLRAHGLSEERPLDFHSPYGCSKGAADAYVLDYARSYGMETVVMRMSCIYGPHQHGTEDQGWVAHFLLRALHGEPITLYGDGKQVRDILFVDDLIDAYLLAMAEIGSISGQAFNMGGGPKNTTSLLELLARFENQLGLDPHVSFDDWRTGDQRYYVSDTRRFTEQTGWQPRYDIASGVARLHDWLAAQQGHNDASPQTILATA